MNLVCPTLKCVTFPFTVLCDMQFLNWAAECHHVMDGGPAYGAGPGEEVLRSTGDGQERSQVRSASEGSGL